MKTEDLRTLARKVADNGGCGFSSRATGTLARQCLSLLDQIDKLDWDVKEREEILLNTVFYLKRSGLLEQCTPALVDQLKPWLLKLAAEKTVAGWEPKKCPKCHHEE